MRKMGINVSLPDINMSSYTYSPDVENSLVRYGLSGINRVGESLIEDIIKNRPYYSIKDFYLRIQPNRQSMISLIQAGVFDNLIDRTEAMVWYIWETSDIKKELNLRNMNALCENNLLPEETEEQKLSKRVYEFNRYLKKYYKEEKESYNIEQDERAVNFLIDIGEDNLIVDGKMSIKNWKKTYDSYMLVFKKWIVENKQQLLFKLNYNTFLEEWNKYALGNASTWEMASLGYYHHEHELAHINFKKYGIKAFSELPAEPEIDEIKKSRNGNVYTKYKLVKICGTCIDKNKTKGTVTVLTTSGDVVSVKFNKEHMAMYDKQISAVDSNGVKKVLEKSWFNKGNMIMVNGIRSGDDFIVKKYADTVGERIYHIDEIKPNGDLILRHERAKGEYEDDEET